VRTTADFYSHAIRGKDHAAAQSWDDVMQRARAETEKAKLVGNRWSIGPRAEITIVGQVGNGTDCPLESNYLLQIDA